MVLTRSQCKKQDQTTDSSSESEFDFEQSETGQSDSDWSTSSDTSCNNCKCAEEETDCHCHCHQPDNISSDASEEDPTGESMIISFIIPRTRKRLFLDGLTRGDDADDEEGDSDEDEDYEEDEKTKCDEPPKKMTKFELSYLNKLKTEEREHFITENKRITDLVNPSSMPYKFKILSSNASDTHKSVLLDKCNQLNNMGFGDHSKYIMWLESALKLPLGHYTPLKINNMSTNNDITEFLTNARSDMDSTIYGQKEVKDQILRILAQWISNPGSKGNVIGIHGERGVGKTKCVKEGISKALGLPFAFVSLGGMHDGSMLTGHHFTYEGSTYGKVSEILIKNKTMNPVIFFDELDKISSRHGDEISGVLMHLTDPVQNEKFNDHYFTDLDLDMSKSLIVFSYNDESLVNPILRDRMITIHVPGYSTSDKVVLCQKHLIDEVIQEFGITRDQIKISDDVIKRIIQKVPEEEGVRNLKRGLECIISWLNMERYTTGGKIEKSFVDCVAK
jgi:ATP-dependent Lon protease